MMKLAKLAWLVSCATAFVLSSLFVQGGQCGEISVQVFMPDKQTPAVNAIVMLSSPDGNLRERLALPIKKQTDANGRARFDGVSEGEYVVRAILGEELISTQLTRVVNINQRVGVWLTLSSPAGDGKGAIIAFVTDEPSRAINNLVLLLRQRGAGKIDQKAIDEFGMLVWGGLEPGEYEGAWVTAQMAKYIGRMPETRIPFLLPIKIEPNKVVRLNVEAGRYLGRVEPLKPLPFLPGNLLIRGSVVGEDGKPLVKAMVQAQGAQITIREGLMRHVGLFGTAFTDEKGQFELRIPLTTLMPLMMMEPMPDEDKPLKGVLLLRLMELGEKPRIATERVEITLPSIAELKKGAVKAEGGDAPVATIGVGEVKFKALQTPTAKLKLIDSTTNMPIARHKFTISLFPIGEPGKLGEELVAGFKTEFQVETDDEGTITIPVVGGRYFVRITADDYLPASTNVSIEAGGAAVKLIPAGTISGRVFIQLREGAEPLPLPYARLQLTVFSEVQDERKVTTVMITTDGNGRYKAVNIPAGRARIQLHCWLYAPATLEGVFVKPGAVTDGIDFVIKPQPIKEEAIREGLGFVRD
jgi:hypothetical protein